MTARILVVDDQPDVLEILELTLQSAGYHAVTAGDAQQALEILAAQPIDIIVSDIAMPGINGYQLYEQVRANHKWATIPFLFLTARAMDSDVRYGKAMGIDDYLTKPIHRDDLLASVQGKLRRVQQLRANLDSSTVPPATEVPANDMQLLTVGPLVIDPQRYQVWLNHEPLQLTVREFTLLVHLALHRARVVSYRELIQVTHALDTDDTEASDLLRPLIRALRRKFGFPVGETGFIATVRGVGYRLTI